MVHTNMQVTTPPSAICYVAGKSGGHILPALTLARHYKQQNPQAQVLFFSTDCAMDKSLIADQEVVDHYVPLSLGDVPYKKILAYPRYIWDACASFFTSLRHLRKHRPQSVISTGGYIAIPVCLAAKLLGIPITIFELNVVPGKATLWLAPLAHKLLICFEQTATHLPKYTCTLTPYPLRYSEQDKHGNQLTALAEMGFSPHKKTILLLGGSQGSVFLNKLLHNWLEQVPQLHSTLQIVHQTGSYDTTDWKSLYTAFGIPAIVFDYCDNLQPYYTVADLIISRAGAGTLFETAFFGTCCITIPLETATTAHQTDNAQAMAQQYPGQFIVIRQDDVINNPHVVYNTICHHLISSGQPHALKTTTQCPKNLNNNIL